MTPRYEGGPPKRPAHQDTAAAKRESLAASHGSGDGRHSAPELSEFGKQVLAAMTLRDRRLVAELGCDMSEIRDFAEALDPDAYDELLVQAILWRRNHSDSSHAISAAIDWRAEAGRPSHAELQRRRYPEQRREAS